MARVLIVDDSKLIRNAASKMLGAEFDVVTADDGAEAWSILERDATIEVVFTDLAMPGLNGFELLRNIRTAADTRISALPTIVVTGVEDDEVARVRALELGATDFITKPFTKTDLVARARTHASHQRETTQLRAQTTLDALTGLANKAGFLDRLQQDMAYARRHKQGLTLVRIEIDDARNIFLQRGKDTAERLVLHVSRLLRTTIRKEDSAGRVALGGFALSLPGGDPAGVERMVYRVRGEISAEWAQIVGSEIPFRLSAAILKPALEAGLTAQNALEECQSKLHAVNEPAAAPAPSTAAPAEASSTVPVETSSTAPPAPAPPRQPRPLQIDPLLEQIERGNPQPAIAGMPLVLRRLMPLLKLLNPIQRDALIRFLQQRK
jgi:diguanylate cyclase (GGDEF)-like protein